ncbi:MAG: tRNA pseudouridine(38-40) synthase TruA [Armatimonadota bacterium]
MPNVKAVIEYDGTDFHGFQIQPSVRTVQGVLESTLAKMLGEPDIKVIGSGRTDAGVHATGQVINFRVGGNIPIDRISPALNGYLPDDVRIKRVEAVNDDFSARYSAKSRTYIYIILNRERPSALLTRYAWQVMQPLNTEAMRDAVSKLVGVHDFSSFGMPDRIGGSTKRQLHNIIIGRRKDAVFFKIRANAFLRGMARVMVGTLVEIGKGKRDSDDMERILGARDRKTAGVTAPPQGLYLTRVEY